uniref:Uncharacterized protein n=1 Tax=Oryza nivara TaxID=4536 RepID=A0A0E0IIH7_ORYNI
MASTPATGQGGRVGLICNCSPVTTTVGDINTIVCYRSSPSLPQRPRSSYSSSSPCPHAFTTSTVAPSHPGSSGSVDPPVTGMLDSRTHCGATRRRIPPRGELAAESSWERS